jgi:hypothetical protein
MSTVLLTRQFVRITYLPNGAWMSTLDYLEGPGKKSRPHAFESVVFDGPDDMSGIERHEYATQAEAIAGHDAIVARYGGQVER